MGKTEKVGFLRPVLVVPRLRFMDIMERKKEEEGQRILQCVVSKPVN